MHNDAWPTDVTTPPEKVKIQNKEDIKILFSYNIQKLLKI